MQYEKWSNTLNFRNVIKLITREVSSTLTRPKPSYFSRDFHEASQRDVTDLFRAPSCNSHTGIRTFPITVCDDKVLRENTREDRTWRSNEKIVKPPMQGRTQLAIDGKPTRFVLPTGEGA